MNTYNTDVCNTTALHSCSTCRATIQLLSKEPSSLCAYIGDYFVCGLSFQTFFNQWACLCCCFCFVTLVINALNQLEERAVYPVVAALGESISWRASRSASQKQAKRFSRTAHGGAVHLLSCRGGISDRDILGAVVPPADRLTFCDHLKANAGTTKDAQKHVAQTSHH